MSLIALWRVLPREKIKSLSGVARKAHSVFLSMMCKGSHGEACLGDKAGMCHRWAACIPSREALWDTRWLWGPLWVFRHHDPGKRSAASRYLSSCRQSWLGVARWISRDIPAELVTAGEAKGVVQHGEERAGTRKVQNISVKFSHISDRIHCDCVVLVKQLAEKLILLKLINMAKQGLGLWPSES